MGLRLHECAVIHRGSSDLCRRDFGLAAHRSHAQTQARAHVPRSCYRSGTERFSLRPTLRLQPARDTPSHRERQTGKRNIVPLYLATTFAPPGKCRSTRGTGGVTGAWAPVERAGRDPAVALSFSRGMPILPSASRERLNRTGFCAGRLRGGGERLKKRLAPQADRFEALPWGPRTREPFFHGRTSATPHKAARRLDRGRGLSP